MGAIEVVTVINNSVKVNMKLIKFNINSIDFNYFETVSP